MDHEHPCLGDEVTLFIVDVLLAEILNLCNRGTIDPGRRLSGVGPGKGLDFCRALRPLPTAGNLHIKRSTLPAKA